MQMKTAKDILNSYLTQLKFSCGLQAESFSLKSKVLDTISFLVFILFWKLYILFELVKMK